MWIVFFFQALMGGTTPHPIHLSVTEIYRESTNGPVTASITFFADDFAVAANYKQQAAAINSGQLSQEDFILHYLKERFSLQLNGQTIDYSIAQTQSNFPAITCYLDLSPEVVEVKSLEVENTLLLELFDDQKNTVNIDLGKGKQGALILDHRKKKALHKFK